MNEQTTDIAISGKGVTPDRDGAEAVSISPGSQSDEDFHSAFQSINFSAGETDRQGSSSNSSDKYLSAAESDIDEARYGDQELDRTPGASHLNWQPVEKDSKAGDNESVADEAETLGNLRGEVASSDMSSIVNTLPVQTAASPDFSTESETRPTAAAHDQISDSDGSSIKRGLSRRRMMKPKIEAARQTAVERETARRAAMMPVPRITIAQIPPFRRRSESQAASPTSTHNSCKIKVWTAGISTQPVTPLSEKPKGSGTGPTAHTDSDSIENLQATPSSLSALAAEFVPSGNHPPFRTPTSLRCRTGQSNHEVYTNNISDIPSHWVPLYGASHGSFFDPATSMVVGDGAPRRTLKRLDSTLPAQPYESAGFEIVNRPPRLPTDAYHIQPGSFTTKHVNAHLYGDGMTLFYCSCIHRWTTSPHNCVISPEGPMPSQAILPRAPLLPGWITREINVVDTGYLDNQMVPHQEHLS